MWFFFYDAAAKELAELIRSSVEAARQERAIDEAAERAQHFDVQILDLLHFTQDVPRYGFKAGDVGVYHISFGDKVFIKGHDLPTTIVRSWLNLWIETGVALWSVPRREWTRRKQIAERFGG